MAEAWFRLEKMLKEEMAIFSVICYNYRQF